MGCETGNSKEELSKENEVFASSRESGEVEVAG